MNLQPVFQHCERLVIDAERWQQAHDFAQNALTVMNGIFPSPAAVFGLFSFEVPTVVSPVSQVVAKLLRNRLKRLVRRFLFFRRL